MKKLLTDTILVMLGITGHTGSYFIQNETSCDATILSVHYVCRGTCSPMYTFIPNKNTGNGCAYPCPWGVATTFGNGPADGYWIGELPPCNDVEPAGFEFTTCEGPANDLKKVWDLNCSDISVPQGAQAHCICDGLPVIYDLVRIPRAGAPDVMLLRVHH